MASFKIKTNTEVPSEQFILQNQKGFKNVLQKFSGFKSAIIQKTWIYGGSAGIVATAVILTYFLAIKPGMDQKQNQNQPNPNDSIVATEKFVDSPFDQYDIPMQMFSIDNSKPTTITSALGSMITIPANAFKGPDGKPVKGIVKIAYREFHNVVDLFRSGIPMTYDSAGKHSTFESAGMFEIRAFQNDVPLELAERKNIKVDLVSYNEDPKFNLYYLDTTARNWEYLTKSNYTPEDGLDLSQNTADYTNSYNPNQQIAQEKEFVKPAIAGKSKYIFKVDYDKKMFPELDIYQNVLFEVAETKSTFRPSLYEVYWQEIHLKKSKLDGYYILTLSRPDTTVKLWVYPVFAKGDYQKAIATYNAQQQSQDANYKIRKAQSDSLIAMRDAFNNLQVNSATSFNANGTPSGFRSTTISRMGTFNCDHPIPVDNYTFSPAFTDNNQLIVPKKIYLSDKIINALYEYDGTTAELKCNRKSVLILWIITQDGQMAVIGPEEFDKATKKTNKPVFAVNLTDPNTGLQYLQGLLTGGKEETQVDQQTTASVSKKNTITENATAISISCYPNPAKDFINIDVKDNMDFSGSIIKIYNSGGTLVQEITAKAKNEKNKIDISTWTTGMYFCRIEGASGISQTVRFIKES
jgi:hypothetical protein